SGVQTCSLQINEVYFQVMEAKHHGQFLFCFSCIAITVFQGSTGHLSHGNNLRIRTKGRPVQLLKISVYIGTIRIKPSSVSFKIVLKTALADQIDHIEAES